LNFVKVIFIGFLTVSITFGQYSFDVKTQLEEKHRLQIAKQGVLHSIRSSSWASIEDVGEDFSLWLVNLNRQHQGDSIYVFLQVQLRSPAMFSSGNYLSHRNVIIRYHWDEIQLFAKDSIDKNLFTSNQGNAEELTKSMVKMASFASTLSGASFLGAEEILGGLSSAFIASTVGELGGVLQKEPSPVEVLESLMIGAQVLEHMESMIRERKK